MSGVGGIECEAMGPSVGGEMLVERAALGWELSRGVSA